MHVPNTSPNLFNASQYYTELDEAVAAMATAPDEDRGAIFTKPSVANFILDLVGYSTDQPLHEHRLLEPAAGTGALLLPAIDRLLEAWSQNSEANPATLAPCIRAVELHKKSFQTLKERVSSKLTVFGFDRTTATLLCDAWLIQGDFLLTKDLGNFDFVVGNPPYVRQEKISPILLATYRAKYKTLYDRADLYVPFYERSLKLLRPHGTLGFICTDRWTKNKYGAPLRRLVAKDYHLKTYVDLVGAQAFTTDVATYPAITVIQKSKGNNTRFLAIQETAAVNLQKAASQLSNPGLHNPSNIIECTGVINGSQPWVIGAAPDLQLVRQLEQRFPTLEAAGCKVAIGVATGADKVFIADYAQLDVEKTRKLPLATTKDLCATGINWQGRGILNPYEADGTLADLDAYPRFKAFVLKHQEKLAARHVAKKSPAKWYKTIDRIYPELTAKPKLLIPDIKGHAAIVYENEGLYPHHNLYYLTSDTWDLRALQSVLRSGIAELFVSTYSTRMRGGYIRYQAQYLRRIRVPEWSNIPAEARELLIKASKDGDFLSCQALVFDLYGLTQGQRELITSKQQ